jgi:hypothetical protein
MCCQYNSWCNLSSVRKAEVEFYVLYVPALNMKPTPIGINNYFSILRGTASFGSARLPCKLRVHFLLLCSYQLTAGCVKKGSGDDQSSVHVGDDDVFVVCSMSREAEREDLYVQQEGWRGPEFRFITD